MQNIQTSDRDTTQESAEYTEKQSVHRLTQKHQQFYSEDKLWASKKTMECYSEERPSGLAVKVKRGDGAQLGKQSCLVKKTQDLSGH